MNIKKSLCVFCGASNNVGADFLSEGKKVGKLIADKGYHMVFGAGDCGMMGATANAALENGGTVTGVFPRVLDGLEKEHSKLTELITVDDMHTRKMLMFNKADAFIILPGGFGTMDETFEVITWKQLHTHDKPVVFYNYKGYWDKWEQLTNHFLAEGFAGEKVRSMYKIANTLAEVFALLEAK